MPLDGQKRCRKCSKIKHITEFKRNGRRHAKRCNHCANGISNKITYSLLDKALPPLSPQQGGMISGVKRQYRHEYPILLHLALRANGVPVSSISKRMGIDREIVKYWTNAMGVVKPGKRVCASGQDHPLYRRYGGELTIRNGDKKYHIPAEQSRAWANEKREMASVKRVTSWMQHPLAMAFTYRAKYHGSSPQQKIKQRLRNAIRQAIVNNGYGKKVKLSIGCEINFLKSYIEARWQAGMNWDNYGKVWVLDHIFPLAKMNLSTKRAQLMANHYTNLQPMFVKQNLSKGDKVWVQQQLI